MICGPASTPRSEILLGLSVKPAISAPVFGLNATTCAPSTPAPSQHRATGDAVSSEGSLWIEVRHARDVVGLQLSIERHARRTRWETSRRSSPARAVRPRPAPRSAQRLVARRKRWPISCVATDWRSNRAGSPDGAVDRERGVEEHTSDSTISPVTVSTTNPVAPSDAIS